MSKDMTQEQRINLYAKYLEEQTQKAVRPYRTDGYVNLMTRYGTQKDAAEAYRYVAEPQVPDEVLEEFYESNGLFAKIIDTPAEEAVKHGFELEDVTDEEAIEFYTEALDELDWDETAMTAIKWARLFGGSIAVLLVNDGGGLEDPLDWKNIKSIDDIRVYDRSLIQPDYASMFNYDPRDPFSTRGSRLGMPEYYQVTSKYGNFTVHDSRCLVFQNGILPEIATNSIYQMWGMPEYIRINKAIQDAELAHRSAPRLLERSVQPIYKMKDLSAELATVDGENVLLKRLQSVDMARSILNTIVVDSDGEDYDFKSFTLSGISDAISASCSMLSAVTSIPQTVLFGQGVNGLNSTDDTSMENYYNFIERIQRRMLKGNLRYLLSIIFQAGLATGEVDEVPKLNVKFNPLWSLSDSEQAALDQQKAQTQQVKAQTTQIYVDMQAIDPSEVRKKLADSDEYDVETMLDEYDEEDLFEMYEQQEEQPGMEGMEGAAPEGPAAEGMVSPNAPEATQNPAQAPETQEQGEANPQPQEEESAAPEAAPAATKLPQDMSEEEQEEVEKNTDSRTDSRIITDEGNSNSGNRNHKGRPGEVGGSAPSASTMNESLKAAYKAYNSKKVKALLDQTVQDLPLGSKITADGIEYTKVDDENFEYRGRVGKKTYNISAKELIGTATYAEEAPTVEVAEVEETAEKMVESGDLDPDETGVKVEGYEDKEFHGEYGCIGVSAEQYGELRRELSENSGEEITNEQMDTYLDALDAFKGANYTYVVAASEDFGGIYEGTGDFLDDSEKEAYTKKAEALEDFITKADKYEGKAMRALGFDVDGEYTAEQEQGLSSLLDSCKVGSTISMGHTSSWTTEDSVVQQILAHRTGNDEEADHSVEVVFTCNNSTSGVDIAKYCEGTPQAEVMFSKTQEFTVKSVNKKAQRNGNIRYDIQLEEKPSASDSRNDGYPGSVGVIITSHGKVLTGTRSRDTDRGQLCGPGGHIEAGETPEQAAIRETQEEFGVTPKELLLLGHGPQEPGSGLEPYIYLCTDYTGQIRCRDHEMRDPQFLDLQEIEEQADELFQPFADSIGLLKRELGETTVEPTGREDARPRRLMNADALEAAFEEADETATDGGPGSGNWGHQGRPGKIGGSAESGSGYASREAYESAKAKAQPTYERRKQAVETKYANKKAKIKEEHGNRLLRVREVRHDDSLTDEEKEAKIADIYDEFDKVGKELTALSDSQYEELRKVEEDSLAVFDPEYEYDKLDEITTVAPGSSYEECQELSSTINPDGLTQNCQRCAVAYEMRQRGYDVQASDGSGDDLGQPSNLIRTFAGADVKDFSSTSSDELTQSVYNQMLDWGDGARAIISTQYSSGGSQYGHAYNLSVSNGEVVVTDTQIGSVWSDKTSMEAGGKINLGLDGAYAASLIRTDNAKPTIKSADYVKQRGT